MHSWLQIFDISKILWGVGFSLSAPKSRFIFYNSFSLRLTENLHEQKTFCQNMTYMFCLHNFFLKCTIKKIFIKFTAFGTVYHLNQDNPINAQLSKLIRHFARKRAMHAMSRWYRTVYIPRLIASYDTHKGKRWLNSNSPNHRRIKFTLMHCILLLIPKIFF